MPDQREIIKSTEDQRPEVEGHLGAGFSDDDGGNEGERLGAGRNAVSGEDDRPEVEGHLGAGFSDDGGGEEGERLGAGWNTVSRDG